MDSLALIDPSFLVKPNYFTTETSSSSKQSTEGEKVYDLPLEIEEEERSTSRIPSQSSFNEQNYPEYNAENINAILQEDKMTTNKPTKSTSNYNYFSQGVNEAITSKVPKQNNFPVSGQATESVRITEGKRITTSKPLDGAFTDHIYPDFNLVDNSGHGELPSKHTTSRSKTDKTATFEGEKIATSNPLSGNITTDHIYPDYNQVNKSIYGQVPGRHTTLRSITQSTTKYNNSYQEPELPEEQKFQVSNINNIESLDPKYNRTQIKEGESIIGLLSPTSTTKHQPFDSLHYDYDPVPAALNCPQASMCNLLSSVLKKVGNLHKFLSFQIHNVFSVIILSTQWHSHTWMIVRVIFACLVKTLRSWCAAIYKTMQVHVGRWTFVKIGGNKFPSDAQFQNVQLTLTMKSVAQDVRGPAKRLSVKSQASLAATVMREW